MNSYFKGRETPLEEKQWCALLDFSYSLSELPCTHTLAQLASCADLQYYGGCSSGSSSSGSDTTTANNTTTIGNSNSIISNTTTTSVPSTTTTTIQFHPYIYKLKTILSIITKLTPQYSPEFSGQRNIWVVKAPESSCGIGIKVLSRLNDILLCEKGIVTAV